MEKSSEEIHLISRWKIKNGYQKEAEKVLVQFEERARNEPGTLSYLIHRPMWDIDLVSKPTPSQLEVLFYERYANKEAFLSHVNGQKEFMRAHGYFEYFVPPPNSPGSASEMVEFLRLERGYLQK